MLKNRIAVLVAGALIGAQVGIAAQEQENFPGTVDDQYVVSELASLEPFGPGTVDGQNVVSELASTEPADPAATQPVESASTEPADLVPLESVRIASPEPQTVALPMRTAARSDAFPPDAEVLASQLLPALAKYLDERAARLQTAAVRGDAFPPDAEELASKPLPALAKYLEERAARLQIAVRGDANVNVARYGSSASSSVE